MSDSSKYWETLSQVATVVEDESIPLGTKLAFLSNLADKYEHNLREKQPSQIRPDGLKQVERCQRLCRFGIKASEDNR